MINQSLFTATLTVMLLLSFQLPSHAAVYKWEDDNGQIHYSDQPNKPEAEKFNIRQNITTKPRAINSGKKTTAAIQDPAEAESKKPEMVEVEFSKKQKRQFCSEAKNDIGAISNRGRMREINKKGEYVYLSEQQRQQRLSAARKKQREFCR